MGISFKKNTVLLDKKYPLLYVYDGETILKEVLS